MGGVLVGGQLVSVGGSVVSTPKAKGYVLLDVKNSR